MKPDIETKEVDPICPRCESKGQTTDYRYCDYHQKEILREVKIK
jgi:hypothetical protein